MGGVAVLADLGRAGITVTAQGTNLVVWPASRLTPATREAIRANKLALLDALTEAAAERLRHEYEERAAIGKADGGLPRAEAERQAWEHSIVDWLNEPANAEPAVIGGTCPACQLPLDSSEVLVLRAGGGHTPMHANCTPRWVRMRRNQAARGLIAAGIPVPSGVLVPEE